jgi:hypothetical protein
MYSKLDHLRNDAKNTVNYFVQNPDQMIEEIRKYENEVGKAYDNYEVKDRRVFSKQFYRSLDQFDEPEIPISLHDIDESVFHKTTIKNMCKSQLRKAKKVPKPPQRKVRRELIRGAHGSKSQPVLKNKLDDGS